MSKKRHSLFHFTDQEVKRFFRSARRVFRHAVGDLLVLPKTYPYSRLIVIIPKRIATAARRNRIRRQMKAIFYENRLFESQSDSMVIVKPDGVGASFEELRAFLLSATQKNAEKR